MKLRKVGTFDELEAFYGMVRDEYPAYTHPRISAVHYGVFDVGANARGWGEGDHLVAGAAINIGGWDVFEEGGVQTALFEHLIVHPAFRNRGIGTALLDFIVESHCDLTIIGRVSKKDEWQRLVPWYQRFEFHVTDEDKDEVFIQREPDDGEDLPAPALREDAANRRYGEHQFGIDLDLER